MRMHIDSHRLTARFPNGETRSFHTVSREYTTGWMLTYEVGGETRFAHGWALNRLTADQALSRKAAKLKCVVLNRAFVELTDGTVDPRDGTAVYLRVLQAAEGHNLCPKFSKAVVKGKRFLVVGETLDDYLILIRKVEYKVAKRGVNRLTIIGTDHDGKPWAGSPLFIRAANSRR